MKNNDFLRSLISDSSLANFSKHLEILNVDLGHIPFDPYPFQTNTMNGIEAGRQIVISSARQMGTTSTLLAAAAHKTFWTPDSSVLFMSNKFEAAKDAKRTFEAMIYPLMENGLHEVIRNNQSIMEFDNGASIHFMNSDPVNARGRNYNMVLLDNAAFYSYKNDSDILNNLFPTVLSGLSSKIIVGSTPLKPHGLFFDLVHNTNWTLIQQDWKMHPNRDLAWKQHIVKNIGEFKFAQEYELQFSQ